MRAAILEKKTLSWIGIILVTITFLIFKEEWDWLTKYPEELIIPFSDWINLLMEKFIYKFGWFFLNNKVIYFPALALITLHIYNSKYCQYNKNKCCNYNYGK